MKEGACEWAPTWCSEKDICLTLLLQILFFTGFFLRSLLFSCSVQRINEIRTEAQRKYWKRATGWKKASEFIRGMAQQGGWSRGGYEHFMLRWGRRWEELVFSPTMLHYMREMSFFVHVLPLHHCSHCTTSLVTEWFEEYWTSLHLATISIPHFETCLF